MVFTYYRQNEENVSSEKTTTTMRLHVEHESEEGEICHPSDVVEWKYFQQLHHRFADEPQNVYLG